MTDNPDFDNFQADILKASGAWSVDGAKSHVTSATNTKDTGDVLSRPEQTISTPTSNTGGDAIARAAIEASDYSTASLPQADKLVLSKAALLSPDEIEAMYDNGSVDLSVLANQYDHDAYQKLADRNYRQPDEKLDKIEKETLERLEEIRYVFRRRFGFYEGANEASKGRRGLLAQMYGMQVYDRNRLFDMEDSVVGFALAQFKAPENIDTFYVSEFFKNLEKEPRLDGLKSKLSSTTLLAEFIKDKPWAEGSSEINKPKGLYSAQEIERKYLDGTLDLAELARQFNFANYNTLSVNKDHLTKEPQQDLESFEKIREMFKRRFGYYEENGKEGLLAHANKVCGVEIQNDSYESILVDFALRQLARAEGPVNSEVVSTYRQISKFFEGYEKLPQEFSLEQFMEYFENTKPWAKEESGSEHLLAAGEIKDMWEHARENISLTKLADAYFKNSATRTSPGSDACFEINKVFQKRFSYQENALKEPGLLNIIFKKSGVKRTQITNPRALDNELVRKAIVYFNSEDKKDLATRKEMVLEWFRTLPNLLSVDDLHMTEEEFWTEFSKDKPWAEEAGSEVGSDHIFTAEEIRIIMADPEKRKDLPPAALAKQYDTEKHSALLYRRDVAKVILIENEESELERYSAIVEVFEARADLIMLNQFLSTEKFLSFTDDDQVEWNKMKKELGQILINFHGERSSIYDVVKPTFNGWLRNMEQKFGRNDREVK